MDRSCDRCDMPATTMYGPNYGSQAFCRAHADEFHTEERARFQAETEKAGGPVPQTCPRRGEGPWEQGDDLDRWEYGHGIITPELILTCSFCGSVHPITFMERIASGTWQAGTTSKGYKLYVTKPDGETVGKMYLQHLDEAQRRIFIDFLNADANIFGDHGHHRMSSVDAETVRVAVDALQHAPEVGIHFTCSEADAIVPLIRASHGDVAAAQWLHGHVAGDDDETDRHSADWTEEQSLAHVRAL